MIIHSGIHTVLTKCPICGVSTVVTIDIAPAIAKARGKSEVGLQIQQAKALHDCGEEPDTHPTIPGTTDEVTA